jgi:hypothetical protein
MSVLWERQPGSWGEDIRNNRGKLACMAMAAYGLSLTFVLLLPHPNPKLMVLGTLVLGSSLFVVSFAVLYKSCFWHLTTVELDDVKRWRGMPDSREKRHVNRCSRCWNRLAEKSGMLT